MLAAACSPKVHPVVNNAPKAALPVGKKYAENVPVKVLEPQTVSIAMLLPLELDNLNPGAQYTATALSHANLSLDFYQGFKLALDTLADHGANYKLQVYDTKDQTAEAAHLGYEASIRSSNLVVGPIFPDDLHAFADILSGPPKLIVSPLSPASPSHVKNGNLVTVATPLEYHARSAAQFIDDHYKPKKVFILRSGFSDENNYITPFKKQLDSVSKNRAKVIAPVVQHGQLDALVTQLSATEENIFVVPSTNQQFLMVTLRSLDTLSKKYKVTVFGHPNWHKFTYLKPELLQDIKAHITSTDRIDRRSPAVKAFMRDYEKAYHTEPNYYAMMGFDEGLFFGQLSSSGDDPETLLSKTDFNGLLNRYHFVKKPTLGWINTHVNVLVYENFDLKRVE